MCSDHAKMNTDSRAKPLVVNIIFVGIKRSTYAAKLTLLIFYITNKDLD